MRLGALRVLWGRPPGLGVQRGSRLATSNSRKRGPPTESTRARPYHVMPPYSPRKRRATAVRTADRRGGQPSTPGGRWEATATGLTPGDQTAGRASSTTPRIPRAAARTNHAGFTTSGRTQRGRNRHPGVGSPCATGVGKAARVAAKARTRANAEGGRRSPIHWGADRSPDARRHGEHGDGEDATAAGVPTDDRVPGWVALTGWASAALQPALRVGRLGTANTRPRG